MPGLATSRCPVGLYSGTAAGIIARENQLSNIRSITISQLPAWDFATASMGAVADSGFQNTTRIYMPNIHARVGGTHLPWTDVAAGTYDSQLIVTLQSIRNLNATNVYIVAQEEHDGADGVNHYTGTTAQGATAYRAFADHLKALAAVHCPGAKVGQIVADVSRLPTWFWPSADFYGADPHFYGWNANGTPNGGQFAQRMNTIISTMTTLGIIGNKPWSMHVGGIENPNDPSGKANYITQMGQTLRTATVLPDWVTWWDRSGTVNGQPADERIDTSPQSLAAFAAVYDLDTTPPPPPNPSKAAKVFSVMRRQLMMAHSVTPLLPDIEVRELTPNTAGGNTDQNNLTQYTTGTITPTITSGWLVAFVANTTSSGTANQPTVDASFDLGLTWTAEETASNTTFRITCLRAPVSGAITPGTLKFDFSGQTQTGCEWTVEEIENADLSTLFVQSDPLNGSGVSIVTHSLSTFGSTANRPLIATALDINEAMNDPHWGETPMLVNVHTGSAPNCTIAANWDSDTADTAPSMDWTTSTAIRYRSIACEIKKRTV